MSLFIEIPKFRKIVNECDHSLDLIYNQESKYSTCAYHAAKDCDSNLSNDELNELKRVNESIKFNTNIINNHNNILNNCTLDKILIINNLQLYLESSIHNQLIYNYNVSNIKIQKTKSILNTNGNENKANLYFNKFCLPR